MTNSQNLHPVIKLFLDYRFSIKNYYLILGAKMSFPIKLLIFSGFIGATLSTDCLSIYGRRCIPKIEKKDKWTAIYSAGDPCFLYNEKRVGSLIEIILFLENSE